MIQGEFFKVWERNGTFIGNGRNRTSSEMDTR